MYVDSLACVRAKRGDSERFRIHSRVSMILWLFIEYMGAVIKERKGVILLKDGREWRLSGDYYDLVLCGESEEDLRCE